MEEQQCKECGQLLPIGAFQWVNRAGGYYKAVCRKCIADKCNASLEKSLGIKLHDKIRAANRMHINAVRHRAKKKGLDFNLDDDDFVIPDVCPILGLPLRKTWGGSVSDDLTPSIDRVDNTLGYVKGNTMVISQRANSIKSDMTFQELALFCTNMLRYIKSAQQKAPSQGLCLLWHTA